MATTQKALPSLSFEFFPPHSPEASLRLWRSVERLAPLAPRFVSVTYGAGGTTRDRTNAAIQTILGRARLNVAGHLTCVGASREETLEVARGYARMGVRRVVALRGDPPKGETKFVPHPEGCFPLIRDLPCPSNSRPEFLKDWSNSLTASKPRPLIRTRSAHCSESSRPRRIRSRRKT
jgi:5,10-methylenetetrahydrofolate reductase